MNASCHTHVWFSRVIVCHVCVCVYVCVCVCMCIQKVSRMNTSWHTCELCFVACHTYEWVMSHMRMRDITRMNESCHTFTREIAHLCMSHGTHVIDSLCSMSHVWISHVTHVNEGHHTYEWVMSHMWLTLFFSDMPPLSLYIHIYIFIHLSLSLSLSFSLSFSLSLFARERDSRDVRVREWVRDTPMYRREIVYTNESFPIHELWFTNTNIIWVPCIRERSYVLCIEREWEVGGWGRDPKKFTWRDWGMGSSTI